MTKRRDFIKESALGLGATVVGMPVIKSFAKYDFRKGASAALGGGSLSMSSSSSSSAKPKIATRPKKKRAAGGC